MEIGQVYEIKIEGKYGYIQLIDLDKDLGEMIRVFPDLYNSPLGNQKEIAKSKHKYYVRTFLKKAISDKIVTPKKIYKLPWRIKKPKHMRTKHLVQGEFISWQIFDTDTWQITNVKRLSKRQLQLSPWGIWPFDLLIKRMAEEWDLDNWT